MEKKSKYDIEFEKANIPKNDWRSNEEIAYENKDNEDKKDDSSKSEK